MQRRESLCYPWQEAVSITGYCNSDSMLVACDGRIAIAVDIESRTPKIESVLGGIGTVVEWTPFPEMSFCDKCKNAGQVETSCEICGGSGRHNCCCGSEHDCGKCDGSGEATEDCELCRIVLDGPVGVQYAIAGRDARRISTLPVVKYGFAENEAPTIYLKFSGGFGKVMAKEIGK